MVVGGIAFDSSMILPPTPLLGLKHRLKQSQDLIKLKNLPKNRLSKIILDEIVPVKCNEWKYIENIETILQTAGLDHYANENINVNIFNKFILQTAGLDHYANENINVNIFNNFFGNETTNTQLCNILGNSSLNLFQSFVVVSRKQPYLSNVDDFRSIVKKC